MASDRQRPVPRPGRRALVGLVGMVGLVAVSFVGACGSDGADDAPAAATATTGATTSGAASVTGAGSAAYCEAVDELLGVLEPTSLADDDDGADEGEAEPDEPDDEREAFEPLEELARVAAYDRLITQVQELAPAEHARAWELLAAVSEEPFSYDRFNPAVDELERIDDDLEARCPSLGRFVVDDHGRLTRW